MGIIQKLESRESDHLSQCQVKRVALNVVEGVEKHFKKLLKKTFTLEKGLYLYLFGSS